MGRCILNGHPQAQHDLLALPSKNNLHLDVRCLRLHGVNMTGQPKPHTTIWFRHVQVAQLQSPRSGDCPLFRDPREYPNTKVCGRSAVIYWLSVGMKHHQWLGGVIPRACEGRASGHELTESLKSLWALCESELQRYSYPIYYIRLWLPYLVLELAEPSPAR